MVSFRLVCESQSKTKPADITKLHAPYCAESEPNPSRRGHHLAQMAQVSDDKLAAMMALKSQLLQRLAALYESLRDQADSMTGLQHKSSILMDLKQVGEHFASQGSPSWVSKCLPPD